MTQTEKVLRHIRYFGSITALEAMSEYGIFRLAARIADLKKSGYPIVSETVSVENRFGEKCYIKRYSERVGNNG